MLRTRASLTAWKINQGIVPRRWTVKGFRCSYARSLLHAAKSIDINSAEINRINSVIPLLFFLFFRLAAISKIKWTCSPRALIGGEKAPIHWEVSLPILFYDRRSKYRYTAMIICDWRYPTRSFFKLVVAYRLITKRTHCNCDRNNINKRMNRMSWFNRKYQLNFSWFSATSLNVEIRRFEYTRFSSGLIASG